MVPVLCTGEGKEHRMIYERFSEVVFKYRNREFWGRGSSMDTAEKNTKRIQEYIKGQRAQDKLGDRLGISYAGSPFTRVK